jgi:hypothetical protein
LRELRLRAGEPTKRQPAKSCSRHRRDRRTCLPWCACAEC